MDLSVVAVVASIAAGVSILVAIAAVFAARRSTAHADLALKEASRISRASISRINEVQSEASSARVAARRAAERLRSMTKERTTPDSVAAYRVFLREVVEDSKHLLGPEGTGTMKNEALDRLRVGALLGGSDEVLRALRNFALLRTQRPEAPWPSAYAMAYARLQSDLVTAIRNDLGSSEESLTADQIWGAVNARCVNPAFRLALLSPLEDVLRNAGQDPAHYDLVHITKPADYPSLAGSTAATGSTNPTNAGATGAASSETRRRSRRAQSRMAREASAAATETAETAEPPAAATTAKTTTGRTLPDSSDIVWAPLSPGRRGAHAAAAETPTAAHPQTPAASPAAPGREPAADPAASAAPSAGAWAQAVAAQQTPLPQNAPRTEPAQPQSASPTSHRGSEARGSASGAFEDPTPSRISRHRRGQDSHPAPSTQTAAVPGTATASTTVVTAATASMSSAAPTSRGPTASASTEETESVFATAFPEALTVSRAAAPVASGAPDAPGAPAASTAPPAAAAAQPATTQPAPGRTRASSPSASPTASPKATAVAARTVTVPTGPQQSQPSEPYTAPGAPAASAPASGAVGAGGYGIVPAQGAAQAPAQARGQVQGQASLPASQRAEQASAVPAGAVPAVPASTVGTTRVHRAATVPARTAALTGPAHAADSKAPETITVPATPRTGHHTASHVMASSTTPTTASEAWSPTPPSLQDSTELPRARGA